MSVEVQEVGRLKTYETMDAEYVQDVLERLKGDLAAPLPNIHIEAMKIATSTLAVSDNLEKDLKDHPDMKLLLQHEQFGERRFPNSLTSHPVTREYIMRDTRMLVAFRRFRENGPDVVTDEKRAIFTLWSIFFDSYHSLYDSVTSKAA